MHVQPWFLIRHLESSEEALGGSGGGSGGWSDAAPWPSCPPPPVEAHLLCLAACANVGQGDRLTLILSLAQAGEWISGISHLRASISGVYLFCLQ